jgi:mono/diheme cytochrome c family protein
MTMRTELKWLLGIAIAILVILAAGLLWLRSAGGFSARAKPTMMEAMMARMARALALPSGVNQARDPVAPTATNLEMASKHFAAHCAICHNNNGDGRTEIGRNLYPKPPDMRGSGTQRKSDGALFYSIRNGIRLSGMPAWPDDSDEEIWALVTYIRHLPQQTAAERAAMKPYNPKSIFKEPIM